MPFSILWGTHYWSIIAVPSKSPWSSDVNAINLDETGVRNALA